jgi:hypothetical protein
MKSRIAQWLSHRHPATIPASGTWVSPQQLLAHLREHHSEVFEEELSVASIKKSKLN